MLGDFAKSGNLFQSFLNDPKYQGMYKMELKIKSKNGNDSVVHYLKNPETSEIMDFKFKKHSTEGINPWGNEPAMLPGEKNNAR